MKKVIVLGTGAQGAAAAMCLDKEPNVEKIICADYNLAIAEKLASGLEKATAIQVDASDKASIVEACQGMDIIINALPLDYGKNVLEAAIEVKADYQDYAAAENVGDPNLPEKEIWVDGIKKMYTYYSDEFKKIGKTAIIGTGCAPGLICVFARETMNYLDTCDTIYLNVYEAIEVNDFMPVWWSAATFLDDVQENPFAFVNGEIVRCNPYEHQITRKYPIEMGDKELVFTEHAHDEPVYMGINADKFFKGAKNIFFKYGGTGIEFGRQLYEAGLLSKEPFKMKDGTEVVPFDLVCQMMPKAPNTTEEVAEIISHGVISDAGATVIEAYGKKDGKDVLVEGHVYAPGLIDCFEKEGISAEMHITGQSGFLFSKLLVNDEIKQIGLISSDMLSEEENKRYIEYAKELDMWMEVFVKEPEYEPAAEWK
ncbi:MAG: saccharopine dehydrogenase NADP-binding domain-containing protein [Firmicutes bacterium]|nr:saccharopine dehydrogenase NADP-binding domain-containing protein [Bacillota bacterium]